VDQLLRRHQTMREILSSTPLPSMGAIESLIEDLIMPVRKLFETLKMSLEVPLTSDTLWNQE
jgi:hypothetical protein